jgi:hypothetical protein
MDVWVVCTQTTQELGCRSEEVVAQEEKSERERAALVSKISEVEQLERVSAPDRDRERLSVCHGDYVTM